MKSITKYFVWGMVALVAAYDVVIMAIGGKESSISHYLITASYEYPAIPLAVGFVLGHLFWRYPGKIK